MIQGLIPQARYFLQNEILNQVQNDSVLGVQNYKPLTVTLNLIQGLIQQAVRFLQNEILNQVQNDSVGAVQNDNVLGGLIPQARSHSLTVTLNLIQGLIQQAVRFLQNEILNQVQNDNGLVVQNYKPLTVTLNLIQGLIQQTLSVFYSMIFQNNQT